VRECGGECGSAAVGVAVHVAMCGSAAVRQCAGNVRQCTAVYVRQCALPCAATRPCSVGGNTAVRGNVMVVQHMCNSAAVHAELCVCARNSVCSLVFNSYI